MKSTIFSTLIAIAVLGTALAGSPQSSSCTAQHLTRKQASRLFNTAKTEEDHRQLAQFFRWEAQENRKKEQFYLEMSANYRLHPLRVDMYRNETTANRYSRLAAEARALALADHQLAIHQDNLANALVEAK